MTSHGTPSIDTIHATATQRAALVDERHQQLLQAVDDLTQKVEALNTRLITIAIALAGAGVAPSILSGFGGG